MNNLQILKTVKQGIVDREGSLELTGYPHIDKPWLKYYDEDFLQRPLPQASIYDYMKESSEPYQEYPAISYYGNEITYGQLYDNIDSASKVLTSLGASENDRILYLMPNIPETAYLFYGGSRIGAVSDYVDPRPDSLDLKVSANNILEIFKTEKAKYIVALDQCYLGLLKPIENELKELGLENIVIVSAQDSMTISSKLKYASENIKFNGMANFIQKNKHMKLIQKGVKEAILTSPIEILNYSDLLSDNIYTTINQTTINPDDLVVITHTSGTSGRPKPIPLTHNNLNAFVHQTYGAKMPFKPGDRVLHILPYFAAFGLSNVLHTGLCRATNLIEIPELELNHFGKLVVSNKANIVLGPGSWYLSFLKDQFLQNKDLSFIKYITYGGDLMASKDEEEINNFLSEHGAKCVLSKGHGMSEVSGCSSNATADFNDLGTMGIPLPHTTYGVVDPKTKETLKFEEDKDYIEGELIISSECMTKGILDGKTIVEHKVYDGREFILTGDIARMNKDGKLRFISRLGRNFVRFDGCNIKPTKIEEVIEACPAVRYCIVSPYYDEEKFGNLIKVNIILEDGVILDENEKITFVEELLEKYFKTSSLPSRYIPSKVSFIDELPLTKNGKIDYKSLSNQELTGDEINIKIDETNIEIGNIEVTGPIKVKTLKRIK